ncbi:MAG: EAL domain-containing protein [Desulfuromonadales bacterium]|nr:EAL domain-containing protein [Desulfuromonadales bacterium]
MMAGCGDTPEFCRVLVIDDDPVIRHLTRTVLEESGYTVNECPDGDIALESFLRTRPDVLLLDVLLPGKDGFSVCQEIRSHPEGQNVPIVMMTGLDDIDSIHKAYGIGATDFITKPINWQILAYRVHYIFRSSKAFRDLRSSEARLSQAQQLARMGSWEWNPVLDYVQISEPCRVVLDLPSISVVRDISSLIASFHPRDRQHLRKGLDVLMERGRPLSIDCQMATNQEDKRFIHLEAEVHRDADEHSVLVTGTVQDISDRKRSEERIRYLAYYDSLTGLPNRVLFKEHLKRALAIAEQHSRHVAVLFLDLDRFKGINDSLGHDIGDLLLQQVADRLQQRVRPYDTISREPEEQKDSMIARLGGDEFTILLEGIATPEIAARVARRVIETLEAPFDLNGNEAFISCSIGISIYPHDGLELDTLLKNADVAMYSAKDLGRSTYQFYTQEMNSASLQRLILETHLRKAIEKKEFSINYQPKVDCTTNRIVGLEALVRWNNPELGWVSPADFIPIAEDMGLIIHIDRWVISAVCRQLDTWQSEQIPLVRVAVNLSAKHFIKNNLHESIELIRQRGGAAWNNLELEITEGVLMKHTEEVIDALMVLKETGVSISIDDFGTGYSSLSYLTRFPFHTLKIDRSFVSKVNDNPESASIVTAIIALSRSLQKDIIAEGVETIEQLNYLKNSGCSVIQGYLFSRPLPEHDIRQLLLQGSIIIPLPDTSIPTSGLAQ